MASVSIVNLKHGGKVRAVLLVAMLAITLVVLSSTSAFAATNRYEKASNASEPSGTKHCWAPLKYKGTFRASACFKPKGDKFYLADTSKDGYHVEIRAVDTVSDNSYRCVLYGAGQDGWHVCNSFSKYIPEDSAITGYLAIYNGSTKIASVGGRLMPAS